MWKDISTLKNLNRNKIITEAHKEFQITFKTIITSWLLNYKGLPLTWEDIYFEFLYEIPDHIYEYAEDSKVSIKTYLGIKCKYFTSSKCRSFSSNKHRTMNTYHEYDDTYRADALNEANSVKVPLNISSLSDFELKIYNDYFLEEMSKNDIEKKWNITRYLLKRMIRSICYKLEFEIKTDIN